MKKNSVFKVALVLVLVLALIAGTFILPAKSVSAAEDGQQTIKIKSADFKKAKVKIAIYINGQKVKRKGFKVTGTVDGKKHTFVYVPCESFAGAIDAEYTKKNKDITIVTGENWKVTFTAGKDGYTYSAIVGKKYKDGPLNLGKTYTKNNIIYVPSYTYTVLAEKIGYKVETELKGKKFNITLTPPDENTTVTSNDNWQSVKTPTITKEINRLVGEAQETYEGGTITPVAQIVKQSSKSGEEFGIIGRFKAAVPNAEEKFVFFVLLKTKDGRAQITEVLDTNVATQINGLAGGWEQSEDVVITADEMTGFKQLMSNYDGVEYTPLCKVSQQTVSGINVCVFCQSRVIAPAAPYTYSFVYLSMDSNGAAKVTGIKTFNPEELKKEQAEKDKQEENIVDTLDISKASDDDYLRRTDGQFEAYTELGLAAALEECMKLNGNQDREAPDFVEIKTEVKNDITISHEISSMASVVLTNGATITIEKDGILQAAVDVLQGCNVIVKDGGKLWTTQGGDIENDSTISVEKGGELKSMFGGSVINTGTIKLSGVFYCGSVRYEGNTSVWFKNQGGKVSGSGEVISYGSYFDEADPLDMNDCVTMIKTELGKKTKITVSVDPESPSPVEMGGEE